MRQWRGLDPSTRATLQRFLAAFTEVRSRRASSANPPSERATLPPAPLGLEENVTRGLDMGAVDYVIKPFSASELTARIRAALRQRAGVIPEAQPQPYALGDLAIDYARRRVTLAGVPVELTPTEYGVLYELSAHAGTVLTHQQLLVRVWGVGRSGDNGLVRTIVRRLRARLGDDADNPRYIFTEPRVGYWMAAGEGPSGEPTSPPPG